jgi:hypothetical protein
MTRRDFLGFFMLGGLLGLLRKKLAKISPYTPQKAMFWKHID